MAKTQGVEHPGSKFSQVLDVAAKLPGVRINRAAYLGAALKRHCTKSRSKELSHIAPQQQASRSRSSQM